jgi:DNA-binding MarR family transcriptional regulator
MYVHVVNALESELQIKHGLTLSEFTVLQCLAEHPEHHMRMQQLADSVGLSQSAMSRLVERLEAESCGLLERFLCLKDRRGVYTQITEKGLDRLNEAYPTYQSILTSAWGEVVSAVDTASLEQAFRFLKDRRTKSFDASVHQ